MIRYKIVRSEKVTKEKRVRKDPREARVKDRVWKDGQSAREAMTKLFSL